MRTFQIIIYLGLLTILGCDLLSENDSTTSEPQGNTTPGTVYLDSTVITTIDSISEYTDSSYYVTADYYCNGDGEANAHWADGHEFLYTIESGSLVIHNQSCEAYHYSGTSSEILGEWTFEKNELIDTPPFCNEQHFNPLETKENATSTITFSDSYVIEKTIIRYNCYYDQYFEKLYEDDDIEIEKHDCRSWTLTFAGGFKEHIRLETTESHTKTHYTYEYKGESCNVISSNIKVNERYKPNCEQYQEYLQQKEICDKSVISEYCEDTYGDESKTRKSLCSLWDYTYEASH